jgi:hypothetical protein
MTIKGDPDGMIKVAKGVLAEPYAYVERAKTTMDGPCRLPALAFGIAPSIFLSGPYEEARDALARATGAGADTMKSMAIGFANVAHAMGGAEQANTLSPSTPPLEKTDIQSDGSDSAGTEAAVFGVEVFLMAEWVATGGVLTTCGILAPAALASVAAWALVEPDDASLSQAISAWMSAGKDLESSSQYLELALDSLQDAWPSEDTSRQAFDRWQIPFNQDFGQLQGDPDTVAEALSGAVEKVHDVQTDFFVLAAGTLAAILVLTALDAIPFVNIGAETTKEILGVTLSIETGSTVLVIAGICKDVFDALKGVVGSSESFDMSKPGQQKVPDFKQLPPIQWASA